MGLQVVPDCRTPMPAAKTEHTKLWMVFFMVTGVLQGTSAYRVLVGIQGFFLGFA